MTIIGVMLVAFGFITATAWGLIDSRRRNPYPHERQPPGPADGWRWYVWRTIPVGAIIALGIGVYVLNAVGGWR